MCVLVCDKLANTMLSPTLASIRSSIHLAVFVFYSIRFECEAEQSLSWG